MHAKLRQLQPSSFERTLNCPGWGVFCDKHNIPPTPTKVYAAEGSVAHALAERCLNRAERPGVYLGRTGWYNNGRCGIDSSDVAPMEEKGEHFIFKIDNEMVDAVDIYIEECRRKRRQCIGAQFHVEARFELWWIAQGLLGTADHTIINPLGTLYVDDLKYGKGKVVEVGQNVGDNPQLCIYGLGALGKNNPHMVEDVEITITQPRAPHSDGPVRSITFDVDELVEWGNDVLRPAAKLAVQPDAPLKAGEWCGWCHAENVVDAEGRLLCPAKREAVTESAKVMFGVEKVEALPEITPPNPAELTGDRLDKILAVEGVFANWIQAVKTEAYNRLRDGSPNAPTTFKLVAGKLSNRKWGKEEKEILAAVSGVVTPDMAYEKKLLTPPKMEALLKRLGLKPKEAAERIADLLAERTEGKPLMVSADDKRKALPPLKDQMFNTKKEKE